MKKTVIVVSGLLILALVVYYLWYKKNNAAASGAVPASAVTDATSTTTVTTTGDNAALKQQILSMTADQWKDSVSSKIELMSQQELQDMVTLYRIQNGGLSLSSFSTDDQGRFAALKQKYQVFV